MSLLQATGLAQSFGNVDIFSGVSVTIPPDGKIGLVGPNGIGKTTLLLILARHMTPSRGSVHMARDTTLGYLTQESGDAFDGRDHAVYEELLTIFTDLRGQERELRRLEETMAEGDFSDELFERYSRVQEKFELNGGYDYELRIKQVLTGLGFGPDKWSLQLDHLSGGQKTRVLLARLLLERPRLLILDEPTNHLDVQAIEWLEGMLVSWEGALLIVSHDRYFLDRVVNNVWEMSRNGMETYRGNYSAYVQQREERWTRREKEYEATMERLEKEMDYIRRNIAGQRTQQAKGKLSRLSREVEAIHAGGVSALSERTWARAKVELDIKRAYQDVEWVWQRIKAIPRPSHRPAQMRLRLHPAFRSGDIVLRGDDVTIGYPGAPLFHIDHLDLRRREIAALIGPNGTGKSTFLKVLLGQLETLQGQVDLGASLEVGYFAQAHDTLDLENSVLDELLQYRNMLISEARNYLGQYLFRGDEVFQPIHTLSGGERGRLALAILSLSKANFLLLDEPTNHLDIPAQETLQDALENFDGTILLVTHDRYLVDRLATQIWALDEGRLDVFPGTYQEYLAARRAESDRAAAETANAALTAAEPETPNASNGNTLSKNEQRRRTAQLQQLLDDIGRLEQRLDELTHELQAVSAAQDFDKIQRASIEYETVRHQLETQVSAWEKMASE